MWVNFCLLVILINHVNFKCMYNVSVNYCQRVSVHIYNSGVTRNSGTPRQIINVGALDQWPQWAALPTHVGTYALERL